MSDTLLVRTATEADIAGMSAIRLRVTENVLSNPDRITPAMYRDYLGAAGKSWVCLVDGAIAGFSSADHNDNSIWALFVDPPHEGKGIGARLLAQATGYLFGLGAARISLSTTAHTRADRFYAQQGWRRGEETPLSPGPTGAARADVRFTLHRTHVNG